MYSKNVEQEGVIEVVLIAETQNEYPTWEW